MSSQRSIKRRALLACSLALSVEPCLCSAQAVSGNSQDTAADNTLTRLGATGLILTPTPATTPDGDFQIAGFGHTKVGPDVNALGSRTTAAASFGLIPNMELGVTAGDFSQHQDLTGNLKWRILNERGGLPSFAIGVAELSKGNGESRSTSNSDAYAVFGKQFLSGSLAFSAGIMSHSDVRPFAGLNARVASWASVAGEFDGHDLNGALLFNLPQQRWQARIERVQGGWAFGGGFRFNMASDTHDIPGAVTLDRPGLNMDPPSAVPAILKDLVALRLENLECSDDDGIVSISYEDRSYAHNPMDSLANVLAVAAAWAPKDTTTLKTVIERDGIPVLQVSCPLSAYLAFMNGGDIESFQRVIVVEHRTKPAPNTGTGVHANPTYGHGDLFIRPGIYDQLDTEQAIARGGLAADPDLELPIMRGLSTEVRAQFPLAGPLVPRNQLLYSAQVDFSSELGSGGFFRTELGTFPSPLFPGSDTGGQAEFLYQSDNQPVMADATVAIMKDSNYTDTSHMVIGTARYYLAQLDSSVSLSAGKYLFGDSGGAITFLRRFGDTEISVRLAKTTAGGLLTLGAAVPIGPGHISDAPSALRVRPPDFVSLSQSSAISSGANLLSTAETTAFEPTVNDTASNRLFARDRLNRQYILRSLNMLRRITTVKRAP